MADYERHAQLTKEKSALIDCLVEKMKEIIPIEKQITEINAELVVIEAEIALDRYGFDDLEAQVYQLRYVGKNKKSLDEIADILFRSRSYVGHISAKVSKKIKKADKLLK
jgi:DNA-directed RNA polymerase specialized sigma subunit